MAVGRSMAVWCVGRGGNEPATAEVHFNYWRLVEGGHHRPNSRLKDFVELGIQVSNARAISQAKIYLPVRVERHDIEDCGPFFADKNIAQAIFNERVGSANPADGPRRIELSLDGAPYRRIYQFGKLNDLIDSDRLGVQTVEDGTLLTITELAFNELCQPQGPQYAGYFRLRISLTNGDANRFIAVKIPADRPFQSAFDEIVQADFRLNEARTLPDAIESMMRNDQERGGVEIDKVAFLTAIPLEAELSENSSQVYKKRVFERELWKKYAAELPDDLIVYHWRSKESPVKEFSSFAKLRIRRSNWKIVGLYLFLAFIFGVAGNLVASQIDSRLLSKSAEAANTLQPAKASQPIGKSQ